MRKPMPLGQGAVGRAGTARRPVQIADIASEPGYAARSLMLRAGYRAILAVPLLREDSLVGGLVLCRKTPGAFASETVELVQTLANQSVLAIQNAEPVPGARAQRAPARGGEPAQVRSSWPT